MDDSRKSVDSSAIARSSHAPSLQVTRIVTPAEFDALVARVEALEQKQALTEPFGPVRAEPVPFGWTAQELEEALIRRSVENGDSFCECGAKVLSAE